MKNLQQMENAAPHSLGSRLSLASLSAKSKATRTSQIVLGQKAEKRSTEFFFFQTNLYLQIEDLLFNLQTHLKAIYSDVA